MDFGTGSRWRSGLVPFTKLKICCLLPDPYSPDTPARPAVRAIFGEQFTKLGHEVIWVVRSPVSRVEEEFFKGVRVCSIPYHSHSSLLLQILTRLRCFINQRKLVCRIVEKGGCSLIQVRNDVLDGLLAIYVSSRYKIPWVFQYSFPLGEGDLERAKFESDKLRKVTQKARGWIYNFLVMRIIRRADLVLPISSRMEEMLAIKGVPRTKMMCLPLGADTELFSPQVSGRKIRSRYNLDECKVVIYLGELGKLRRLEVLINAFADVKQNRADVKLLMVGDGDAKIELERLAASLQVSGDVIFTGQVPYYEVPHFIAAADIGVSPGISLPLAKLASPAKLFEMMAVGKPVVAHTDIPDQRRAVEESGGGILVSFESRKLAEAISVLLENEQQAKEMGKRGRAWVLKYRTFAELAEKVERRYLELLSAATRAKENS